MKQRLFLTLSEYFFPLLLVGTTVLLCVLNYSPGTYLAGWDDLHPEFNFSLAFERALNGVWRENQGLGAVAIHSHMSELPRIAILWVFSLLFPLSFVRYAFFFCFLILGPLGIFFLTKKILSSRYHHEQILPFFAGLFYLFNLGTVQQFTVPFEMFAVQYGLIGWLFLFAMHYIVQPQRKWLVLFFFGVIFAAPMAFAATLWYAWFGCFILFALLLGGKHTWGRAVFLIGATLALNLYWILPNIYAAKIHGLDVRYSKVNQLFSPEAFAKNQLFGNPTDAVVLKNFLFDWNIYNPISGRYDELLKPWLEHIVTPLVPFFGYVVFGLSVLGIYWAIREKNKKALSLLPMYILSLLMLTNGMWPMTIVFDQLGRISEIAREALRFPFTKFSILFMTAISLYAALGIAAVARALKRAPTYLSFLALLLCFWTLLYAAPAFTGNLIHPAMRIAIPHEYLQMFSWFNQQNHDGRVAILPIHTFWNWVYYDWGYQGAGFLQFGIPQPLLDRDYDRWNPANEQYQREMAYAVYSQNPQQVKDILKKYNIKWILFDTSIASPGAPGGSTLSWFIPQLLSQTPGVTKAQSFGDHITVYEVTDTTDSQIQVYSYIPTVGPEMIGSPLDMFFARNGLYSTQKEVNEFVDDTRKFFSRDERFIGPSVGTDVASVLADTADTEFSYCDTQHRVVGKLTKQQGGLVYQSTNGSICDYYSFPTLAHDKAYLVRITTRQITGFPLQLCISNDLTRHCTVSVHLHNQKDFETETFLLPPLFDYGASYTLNLSNFAVDKITSVNQLQSIYIEEIPFASITIPPTAASAIENTQILLDTKKLSPSSYRIDLDIKSDQNIVTLNQAYEIGWSAWQFSSCKLLVGSYWLSDVGCQLEKKLFEQFPYLFGTKIEDHVLVNNWANAWQLDRTQSSELSTELQVPSAKSQAPSTIILFFLPQLLQWLGFVLFPLPFLFLSKPSMKQK